MDWWYTTCSTDGCNFITEGDSIGFDCATTRTLDSGCLEIKVKTGKLFLRPLYAQSQPNVQQPCANTIVLLIL